MKKIMLFLSTLIFCTAAVVMAVPPGKTLTFEESSQGPVLFSGTVHKDAGISCKECHNKDMFPKKKQGTVTITMEQIYAGELCGKCHNGTRSFAAKESCDRCHVKK